MFLFQYASAKSNKCETSDGQKYCNMNMMLIFSSWKVYILCLRCQNAMILCNLPTILTVKLIIDMVGILLHIISF